MKPIAVIDSETDPFKHGRIPQPFIWGYYDGERFTTFESTDSLVSFISQQERIIYAHNGGKFDFHYLLPYVKSTKTLIINGRIVEMHLGKATLRDSFAIVPIALIQYKKDDIDYSLMEDGIRQSHMATIISYLRGDCVYLYELVSAFIAEFGNNITLASAGFKRAKQMDSIANFNTNRLFYRLFRPYYHGGRVSIFHKGIIRKKTYIYDINSAYPYAMVHSHPFGNSISVSNESFDASKLSRIDELSFYVVEGQSKGIFPFIHDRKLSYPNDADVKEYYVTGYELQAALDTQSFSGTITKRISFSKSISFPQYIGYYYQQKASHKKGTIPYILAKLAMNSVYGKLGANPDKYVDYIICEPSKARNIMESKGAALVYLGDTYTLLAIPIPDSRKRFYNVATAASITGFVRALLWRKIHEVKQQNGTVYYCDTDSIITDIDSLDTGKALGEWDMEQTNRLLYLYAPKIYAAQSDKGKWKVASKGVQLEPNDILRLLKGQSITWHNQAPTFKIMADTTFIDRTIGA